MFKIFLPGQKVPEWLFKQTATQYHFKFGKLTFNGVCLVTIKEDEYYARNIIGNEILINLKKSENISVTGQSIDSSGGNVVLNVKPILTWFEFVLMALLIFQM